MAPRFQFCASKFRNVECKLLPREQSFDQLQVSPSVDGNLLACSSKSFTFAHQMDGGGAIQVKSLSQTGKEAPSTPPLIRAHPTGRVTALAFSPFHEDLLLSAGDANAAMKIWKLPSEPLTEDLRTPIATFQQETGTVAGIVPHPSADAVVATYSRPGALRVYDIEAEKLSYEVLQDGWTLSSAAWNWDGSLIVLPTQDQAVQLLDPRAGQTAWSGFDAAHTGKRHLSVAWCGRTQHFVTCGSDRMQERELKLWDPRQLSKCVHRERFCNDDGALLATASRAKIVRVFDPRQSEHALLALGCGHESSKPQFVVWLNANRLLTVGVGARNETQVSFWDARNLLEPLGEPVLVEPAASAASTTTPLPLYDPSSRLLFLVGTGSRHIWSYEVDLSTATLQANLPFMLAGTDTIGGVALLPKSLCNVRDVELAQLLVATPNVVERVSFSLPRAQKLKVFFQDDVFGPTRRQEPTLNAAQWFAGESAAPIYDSLRPDGMVPLSEKPKNVAPVRPKTLDFQAQLREEEEKERQKAAQFARLSTLAAQPSLHSTHHTGVKPLAPQTLDDDSDDDWDD
ncbi:hypothetical protein BBJ29_005340 [Phytophthora kernoviae]|uniref:DUF1899 domain-containing protein n=1 Tax=Phytophthora kernoviae TaxID=325452 RepID=A0A3F2RTS9_9STRA|nr:hypothetical protein BBP00_00003706 [Phytophthora kernoviae]RLN71248.1 hypothetical protein BBJ29_005340 [Phytophthora kernoviae]